MSATLRVFLVALVLVNLAFVHATEALGMDWLLPLYALTLASPLLARLRESVLYRSAWNLAVLGLFGLLVQHATSSAAMEYLLEDGLRLAAICQVHLLNNLGRRQRPDLLFFNSFLIALVTAFLTWDLVYSAVFLAYVPVLVIGMSVHCVAPPDGRLVPPEVIRRVVGDGLRRAAVALMITLAVFVIWPRDFTRRGLLGKRLDFGGDSGSMEIGFSEEVKLGQSGPTTASDKVVLRVHLERGSRHEVSGYMRGATFLVFNGAEWTAGAIRSSDPRWRRELRGVWRRGPAADGPRVRCEMIGPPSPRLFLPLGTHRLQIVTHQDPLLVYPERDGTVRSSLPGPADGKSTNYRLDLTSDFGELGGPVQPVRTRDAAIATHVAPGSIPPELTERARKLVAELPADASQSHIAETFRQHLSTSYEYLPPGAEGAAAGLDEFARGEAGGHCEYFATALALMLRSRRIPCRLVTGYLSEEWDEAGRVLTVRKLNAHAWVEVRDPQAGWYTVDASPALEHAAGARGATVMDIVRDSFASAWSILVSFDEDARGRAQAYLAAAPGRLTRWGGDHPFQSTVILVLLPGMVLLLVRARRARTPVAIRRYRACVRSLGLDGDGEWTPREVLEHARVRGLPAKKIRRLEEATEDHERLRYAVPA